MNNPVQQLIDEQPMSAFQIFVVGICVSINMLDGFDVLVMAFTASSIAADWGADNKDLGMLFSAGLFGMAIGSLFVAPYGDRFGRRAIILLCLVTISIGMFLSAMTQSVGQLIAVRAITGLGIGGMLASINVLVAEYSSIKRRAFCISFLQAGYPIGATIGGVIAVFLLSHYGWRSVYIFGGLVSTVIIPFVLLKLPESLDYMVVKQPPNALKKINSTLLKMGHKVLDALPAPIPSEDRLPQNVTSLLVPSQRRSTLLIWTAFFMVMFSFYFTLSWTPKLLVEAGLSREQGISGSVIINMGGVVGSLILGFLAGRFNLNKMISGYMVTCAALTILFGLMSNNLGLALIVAAFLGFFLFGSMIGLYAIAPSIYTAEVRTTGMGWAIGIGRVGAIISPWLAGILLDLGTSVAVMYSIFAVPMLIAMVAQSAIKDPNANRNDSSSIDVVRST